ncbi:MAG: translation initiation factor IF-2 [Mollicutes bacterium]|nr:translation initiation factor IF-2 [Mollicutes bacterium]MDD7263433.1 translation initiation factor IF-2 [bacterium]MDY4980044.1 translation initiation factor IF-2 [Candidatus Onthovivens sp.]
MKKKKDERVSNVSNNVNKQNKDYAKVNGGVFVFTKSITVGELAKQLNVGAGDIIKKLFLKGKMVNINQYLDDDTIGELCLEYGYDFKKEELVNEEDFEKLNIEDDEKDLTERPPVVTIMGHVDHGKTTLIDAIRNSNLASEEYGGISQEIGAYQKTYKGKKITFIDTPGHEAFSAMRMRGASVTDIVVLVVAADDGVMPQTIEAIDHAKAAQVPIIVAINKMDVPGAEPSKVINELMQHGIIAEEYGGENITCKISAKKKEGIEDLLDAILLQAEMLELKANPKRYAFGTVLEANLDKGEGPKATLLVQNGTLNSNDYIVAGTSFGKIRRMTNEHNSVLKEALPSTPVSVIGLSEVPLAGDHFMAFPTEKQAKDIASKRQLKKIEEERALNSGVTSLDDLYSKINEGMLSQINIVLKADSTGSAEACKASLEKLNNDKVKIKVIRAAAGGITESDVLLAKASDAIIYGFNVRPTAVVRKKAEEDKVEIRLHRIIYAMIEEVEDAINGMIKKEEVEHVLGQAEVRNVFKVSKVGSVAGCYVIDGEVKRDALCRVLRDGVIVYEGKIETLKRFKDDAKTVASGFECGIKIENYNDVHEGDIIEAFEMKVKEDNGK